MLRRKDNELKMQQMNEMKQQIVKLEEELATARAAGPKMPSPEHSPVSKRRPPLELLGTTGPHIVRGVNVSQMISPEAAVRNEDD